MATKPAVKKTPARKAPAKKVVAKKAPAKQPARKEQEPTYMMSQEVKDWIEQASSRLRHLTGEVERLKEENRNLKEYRRFAENRILRSEHE
jgi:hypothetical protein